jgi:DNA-directed RNA polymerase alpha subunit
MRSTQEIKKEIESADLTDPQTRLTNELLLDIRTLLMLLVDGDVDVRTKERVEMPNPRVADLDISGRLRTALSRTNIQFISDLDEWTAQDLLKLRDFGKKGLAELNDLLADYGKSIAGSKFVR